QWKRALPFRPAWGVMKAADTAVVAGLSGAGLAFYLRDGLPAGDMNLGAGVELAGPLYGFESPLALGPIIVGITQSARTGPTVTAFSRSIEPPMLPMLLPLPGIVPVGGSERRSGP